MRDEHSLCRGVRSDPRHGSITTFSSSCDQFLIPSLIFPTEDQSGDQESSPAHITHSTHSGGPCLISPTSQSFLLFGPFPIFSNLPFPLPPFLVLTIPPKAHVTPPPDPNSPQTITPSPIPTTSPPTPIQPQHVLHPLHPSQSLYLIPSSYITSHSLQALNPI